MSLKAIDKLEVKGRKLSRKERLNHDIETSMGIIKDVIYFEMLNDRVWTEAYRLTISSSVVR